MTQSSAAIPFPRLWNSKALSASWGSTVLIPSQLPLLSDCAAHLDEATSLSFSRHRKQHFLQIKQAENRRGLPHPALPLTASPAVGGLVNGSSPSRLEVRALHLCFHCQLCSHFCGCGNSTWVTACCWLELVVNVDPREAERNGGEYCLSLSCHKSEQSDTISEQLTASSG